MTSKKPFFERGFWWWNPTRNDWFIGPAPINGAPTWAEVEK